MKYFYMLFLMMLVFSCTKPASTGFNSMKWEKVDSFTDSSTLVLERMFYDVAPPESISGLIDRLPPLNPDTTSPSDRLRLARWHYWKGRLLKSITRDDSAIWYLTKGASFIDSASYTYTYRRISTLLNSAEQGSADWHLRHLFEDLNYYSDIGDEAMVASVSILIAHALTESYQPDTAMDYFLSADSIYSRLKLPKYVAKNRINQAACLRSLGLRDSCLTLVRELLDDTIVREDFFTYNTVLRNAYIYTEDVKYLNQGYERLMQRDSTLSLNSVFEYFLCGHYIKEGTPESTALADYYTAKAFSRMKNIDDPNIRAAIFQIKSEQMERANLTDSAFFYLKEYIDATNTYNKRKQPAEVAKIQNMKELAQHEYERNETYHKYLMRLLILAIIIVAVGAVAIVIIFKIRERHKNEVQQLELEKMSSELDIERYQKQMLAIALSMEETDRTLSDIREKFYDLRSAGKINANEMHEIDNVIKSHLSNRDDLRQFIELFEKAHPHFISNLKKYYIGLSDSQVKLAIYVYTGMSNKQIASYLNIRSESVKQARWRLRQKMGLSAEESLEDALHALSNPPKSS